MFMTLMRCYTLSLDSLEQSSIDGRSSEPLPTKGSIRRALFSFYAASLDTCTSADTRPPTEFPMARN